MGGTLNPIAPRMAKTLRSFGCFECNRVKPMNCALYVASLDSTFFIKEWPPIEQEAQVGLISLTWVFCHNLIKIHLVVIEILSFSCSVLL